MAPLSVAAVVLDFFVDDRRGPGDGGVNGALRWFNGGKAVLAIFSRALSTISVSLMNGGHLEASPVRACVRSRPHFWRYVCRLFLTACKRTPVKRNM